jgi:hypothetical protein
LVIVVVCVVLFLAGAFSPGRSLRWQKAVDDRSRKAEAKGYEKAGSLGDMSANGFKQARRAADQSAEKGREIHDKIAPD